jgi:hypothetical protein
MSYLPATKLSFDQCTECVTVLTDGMVMVTKANGIPVRFQMKLVDWLILAGGTEQQEFIPLEPVNTTVPPSSIEDSMSYEYPDSHYEDDAGYDDAVARATAPVAPAPPPLPPASVGSKFKWVLNDETYRVAIMTKDGLLQVKSVTDGGGDVHEPGCGCIPCKEIALSGGRLPPWRRAFPLKKTLFADEAAWRASLPQGGVVTLDGPSSRKEEQPRWSFGMSEADKLYEIQERFKVKSRVQTKWSLYQMMDHQLACVEKFRNELGNVTLDEDLTTKRRHVLTLALNRAMRLYKYFSERVSQDPINAKVEPLIIKHHGKTRLQVHIDGGWHDIALKGDRLNETLIVVQPVDKPKGPARVIKDFNELGNPAVWLDYRGKAIRMLI